MALLPAGHRTDAASPVCFIAVNETLLDLSSMPYTLGGITYVPYWVYSNFGVYYSYYSESSTATLYSADRQIYFDLSGGTSYDGYDKRYSAQAINRGGVVFVPVTFVSIYFGLTSNFVAGNGYGDLLRIRDGRAVLSDSEFLSAASSVMQSRYNEYMGIKSSPSPGPPGQSPTPSAEPEVNRSDTSVYLSFQGLPTDGMLKALDQYGFKACFFLSAQEFRESPDLVRKLIGHGHSTGVLCGENVQTEYQEASSLLFEAALVKTLLIAAAPGYENEVQAEAEELDLVYWGYKIGGYFNGEPVSTAALVTAPIEDSIKRADVRLVSGASTEKILPAVLQFLYHDKFTLCRPSEIGGTAS
jgi:hypothetical protein